MESVDADVWECEGVGGVGFDLQAWGVRRDNIIMKILLLGAGFSRNWGGRLAQEVVGDLLGVLRGSPELHRMLTDRRNFEEVLGRVQEQARAGGARELANLEQMEAAVVAVFERMNRHFATHADLDVFGAPNVADRSLHQFLARFDAIYTLNQDLLLECHYRPQLRLHNRWHGWQQPGVVIPPNWRDGPAVDRAVQVLQLADFARSEGSQPIYKLHGSVNWRSSDGRPLLVVGAGKAASIQGDALLRRYFEQFRADLRAGGTRIMAIGYSFSDKHIDDELEAAMATGLRLFVVNPQGLDVLDKLPRSAVGYRPGELTTIVDGFSVRTLRETFGGDDLERDLLERYLAD